MVMFKRILLCFLALSSILFLHKRAHATSITSAQTGNWNDAATWTGGVVPGNGDSVVMANGHTITIPLGVSVTVGTSPVSSGTAAISCSSGSGTGTLVINGTLIYRGNVWGCNNITIGPGATISHDNSVGADVTYTDLVIDATSTKFTSSASPFVSNNATVGHFISVTGGTGCTVQKVYIKSVTSNAALMYNTGVSDGTVANLGTAGSTCTGVLMPAYYFTGAAGSNLNSRLIVNGTSGSRVTFNVAAGATNSNGLMYTGMGADSGMITGSYADVTDCGLPAGPGVLGDGNYCMYGRATTKTFTLDHWTFRQSARVTGPGIGDTGTWTVDNSAFIGGYLHTTRFDSVEIGTQSSFLTGTPTTGVRRFSGNYVYNGALQIGTAATAGGRAVGVTVTNNVFYNTNDVQNQLMGFSLLAGPVMFATDEWANNLFYVTTGVGTQSGATLAGGILARTYSLADDTGHAGGGSTACSSTQNQHPFYTSIASTSVDKFIFEIQCGGPSESFGSNGLLINGGSNFGSNFLVTVKNSIWLPDHFGTGGYNPILAYLNSGACNGSSTWCPQILIHHNTFYTAKGTYPSDGCGIGGEATGGTKSGMYQGGYDNIFWYGSSVAGCIQGLQGITTPVADTFSGTWDYNWTWNHTGTLYHHAAVSGAYTNTPGVHDHTGNPSFSDSTRNFLKWAQTINAGDSTWADVMNNRYALRGTSAYDSSYDPTNLIDYVRVGYTPTNGAVAIAASDGGTVGAVAYVDSTAPTVTEFSVPNSSSSLTISITSLLASDDIAVTGFLVNESSLPPTLGDLDWSSTAQTSYTFNSVGSKTLYAWAKDAAGNISSSKSATTMVAFSSIKAITAFDFNFLSPAVVGTVNENNHTVSLIVPSGTDVTALVPTITITGSSINPNSGTARNFTSPVIYTVTAADSSTQAYTVEVSVPESVSTSQSSLPSSGHRKNIFNLIDPRYLNQYVAPKQSMPVINTATTASIQQQSLGISFSLNRRRGEYGADILSLQKWLNSNGFIITTKGPGSPGSETTFFGNLTMQAVIRFQKSKGIPGTGYFGPLTRAAIENTTQR